MNNTTHITVINVNTAVGPPVPRTSIPTMAKLITIIPTGWR